MLVIYLLVRVCVDYGRHLKVIVRLRGVLHEYLSQVKNVMVNRLFANVTPRRRVNGQVFLRHERRDADPPFNVKGSFMANFNRDGRLVIYFPCAISGKGYPVRPNGVNVPVRLVNVRASGICRLVTQVLLRVFHHILKFHTQEMDVGYVIRSFNLRDVRYRIPRYLVLFENARFFTPPRPTTTIFIPKARGCKCLRTIHHLRQVGRVNRSSRPTNGFLIVLTAERSKLRRHHVQCVPNVATHLKVTHVPARQGRTTPLVLVSCLFPSFVRKGLVRVNNVPGFRLSRVGTSGDQVITARTFRVQATFLAFPTSAVCHVIVVTRRSAFKESFFRIDRWILHFLHAHDDHLFVRALFFLKEATNNRRAYHRGRRDGFCFSRVRIFRSNVIVNGAGS